MSVFGRRSVIGRRNVVAVALAGAFVAVALVGSAVAPAGRGVRSSVGVAQQARPLPVPDAGTALPSRGCDKPAGAADSDPRRPRGGTTTWETVRSGGRRRTYLRHIPAVYRGDRPTPLVVAFHGRGGSPAALAASAGLSDLPAVVVYPRGVTNADGRTDWQGSPWAAQGVDDLALARELVDRLERTACIDQDRVYAVGHSDGGNLAAQVACSMPARVAAAATYGGAFYDQDALCGRGPTAVLEMHSLTDPVVPYAGLRLPITTLPPVTHLVHAQAHVNGCRPEPQRRTLDDQVARYVFTGCTDGRAVEHVRVRRAGHAVPDRRVLGGLTFAGLAWQFLLGQRLGPDAHH